MIFSTKWISDDATVLKDGVVMPRILDTIFCNKIEQCEHSASEAVFIKAYVSSLLTDYSSCISTMLGVENNKEGIDLLTKVATEIYDKGYGDKENLEESISSEDWGDLQQDIYDALKEQQNSEVATILASHIPSIPKLNCFKREEKDEDCTYKAIGIVPLPYKTAGVLYCDDWTNALIKDFSSQDDEVIIALHKSTDWHYLEEEYDGPISDYSNKMALKNGRNIQIHLFKHACDPIATAINMKNQSLSKIWNYLTEIWKNKVH